jgi:hypothetical protein
LIRDLSRVAGDFFRDETALNSGSPMISNGFNNNENPVQRDDGCPGETATSCNHLPGSQTNIRHAYRRLLNDHCGTLAPELRVPRGDGDTGVFAAALNDMLDEPDVHRMVWNYSEFAVLDPRLETVSSGEPQIP